MNKTDWDRRKETLSMCRVPYPSAGHLTFDCRSLSLHLHWLIFAIEVGSCHGIKCSCHSKAPLVLLLSHYPVAVVCVRACERVLDWPWRNLIYSIWYWTKSPHHQRAFDQTLPSDHPLELSSVHIMHKYAHIGAQRQIHTHMLCL